MSSQLKPVDPQSLSSAERPYKEAFSFPSGLLRKVTSIALLFLTGRALSCCASVTVYPAKLGFDPTQYPISALSGSTSKFWWEEQGLKILTGWGGETVCDIPMDRFKDFASREKEEERLLAQYYYGRRLACAHYEEDSKWTPLKLLEQDCLRGLSLMHTVGALKVIYLEKGQSFVDLVNHHRNENIGFFMHYPIDGCVYFTSGTLLCPDEAAFERLSLNKFLDNAFTKS